MQIETNKFYRTRDGRKALVLYSAKNLLPAGCGCVHHFGFVDNWSAAWNSDGDYDENLQEHRFDLVGPWIEPPKEAALTANWHADGRVVIDCSGLEIKPCAVGLVLFSATPGEPCCCPEPVVRCSDSVCPAETARKA